MRISLATLLESAEFSCIHLAHSGPWASQWYRMWCVSRYFITCETGMATMRFPDNSKTLPKGFSSIYTTVKTSLLHQMVIWCWLPSNFVWISTNSFYHLDGLEWVVCLSVSPLVFPLSSWTLSFQHLNVHVDIQHGAFQQGILSVKMSPKPKYKLSLSGP